MKILESIQKILEYGIDLGEITDEESEKFIANLKRQCLEWGKCVER